MIIPWYSHDILMIFSLHPRKIPWSGKISHDIPWKCQNKSHVIELVYGKIYRTPPPYISWWKPWFPVEMFPNKPIQWPWKSHHFFLKIPSKSHVQIPLTHHKTAIQKLGAPSAIPGGPPGGGRLQPSLPHGLHWLSGCAELVGTVPGSGWIPGSQMGEKNMARKFM